MKKCQQSIICLFLIWSWQFLKECRGCFTCNGWLGMRTPIWGQGTTSGISYDWTEIMFWFTQLYTCTTEFNPVHQVDQGPITSTPKSETKMIHFYFTSILIAMNRIELPGIQKISSKVTISKVFTTHSGDSLLSVPVQCPSFAVGHSWYIMYIHLHLNNYWTKSTEFLVCHVYSSSLQVLWGQSILNFVWSIFSGRETCNVIFFPPVYMCFYIFLVITVMI